MDASGQRRRRGNPMRRAGGPSGAGQRSARGSGCRQWVAGSAADSDGAPDATAEDSAGVESVYLRSPARRRSHRGPDGLAGVVSVAAPSRAHRRFSVGHAAARFPGAAAFPGRSDAAVSLPAGPAHDATPRSCPAQRSSGAGDLCGCGGLLCDAAEETGRRGSGGEPGRQQLPADGRGRREQQPSPRGFRRSRLGRRWTPDSAPKEVQPFGAANGGPAGGGDARAAAGCALSEAAGASAATRGVVPGGAAAIPESEPGAGPFTPAG